MSAIQSLEQYGQSLWYDNIQRSLLKNGGLKQLIDAGEIRGVTSNPSIFHNAVAKSTDYDDAVPPMAWAGWTAEQIFTQLAVEDIRAAADLFLPLYRQTRGGDGYVSLEVNPYLASDTQGTLREARRLWEMVRRPNLMIKIPATLQGIPAIREAIAEGINVNVTLIFSLERYHEVMDAYLTGLERRVAAGRQIDGMASVASFFVSRLDSKIDAHLKGLSGEEASRLAGKAAIANARLAYAEYRQVFTSSRFAALRERGAQVQRPLWASTSTKNPAYRDVRYVEELIGPDTVNTVPPSTLDAFRDHGQARLSLEEGLEEARGVLRGLEALGVSVNQATQELETEGVQAFADAYTALIKTVEERRAALQAELGPLQKAVAGRVERFEEQRALPRLFDHDPSLWTVDAAGSAEIRRRLGWLTSPHDSLALMASIQALAQALIGEGYTHALLLGMGGSSLAPEVISAILGRGQVGGRAALDLRILDSTDPGQVLEADQWCAGAKTAYIVSSKSGGTSEVRAFLDYFWNKEITADGAGAAAHFIAITDPGTSLGKLAHERNFRAVFLADSSVGGRYSALTAFGMVPSGLMGHDVAAMLTTAGEMAQQCAADMPAGRNPGAVLGAVMGEAALAGLDKVIFLADPLWEPLGAWLEQLIAESSGKQGKGMLPVDGEPLQAIEWYTHDRVFVYLKGAGELAEMASALRRAGHPVLTLAAPQAAALPAEFYRWEVATAMACAVVEVNGFDQPDVQDNKDRTARKVAQYKESGRLEEPAPVWEKEGVCLFGQAFPGLAVSTGLNEALKSFLAQAKVGDFVAINAYLPRNLGNVALLQALRQRVQALTGLPTTLGFGPRFLHSTGQYHKGGANHGLFMQLTADPAHDLDIPGEGLTFATLERAQALGDLEALLARGRRAVRVHLAPGDIGRLLA